MHGISLKIIRKAGEPKGTVLCPLIQSRHYSWAEALSGHYSDEGYVPAITAAEWIPRSHTPTEGATTASTEGISIAKERWRLSYSLFPKFWTQQERQM